MEAAVVVTEFIREHMVVIASDGHRIGRVDHVKDGQIELQGRSEAQATRLALADVAAALRERLDT